MSSQNIYILGIESSCDDTAASILLNGRVLSNVVASQKIHQLYGGVVPELASRAHQQNIVPVVHQAIEKAGITKDMLSAVAFTRGPGLMGSLLVGTSFAKSLAYGLHIPLIEVNHMQAHILSHFIEEPKPKFPFLCLTVSGGHTQIVLVKDFQDMKVIGETKDDAAGEAFDKSAKLLGLDYPGGPLIDKYAKIGDSNRFKFSKSKVPGYDYSFSGVKTSILYFLKQEIKKDANFIKDNIADLSASIQKIIVEMLIEKLELAANENKISDIAIAGGVSANSGLRDAVTNMAKKNNWQTYFPALE
jgi:N6-L-threonylcarbamoyladenine synthase